MSGGGSRWSAVAVPCDNQAMKLYDSPTAPSPRRVRVFLAEKGIEVKRVEVDLRRMAQFDEAYAGRSPVAAVPMLELDDGTCIVESIAICRYFEALQPEPALFGRDAREQALVEMWSRRAEFEGYLHVRDALRNSHPRFEDRGLPGVREGVPQIPALVQRALAGLRAFLDLLEARFATGTPWLAGDAYSVADITALVTLDFAQLVNVALDDRTHPHLARWYERASARPSALA